MNELKVFVISPSDVKIERDIAKRVCDAIDYHLKDRANIRAILWEYHPMDYTKDAQANIDNMIEKCDIFIIILWNRLGSIIEGYKGSITNNTQVTGTQYEIERILSLKRENIFFFFKRVKKEFSEDELEEAYKQKQMLNSFLENIDIKKGLTKHGYQEFETPKEFSDKLIYTLATKIEEIKNIKIDKKKRLRELISFYEINPNYYIGMYMFFIIGTLLLFFFAINNQTLDITLKRVILTFCSFFLFATFIAVKSIPIEPKVYEDKPIKEVAVKLIKIGSFMIGISLLTAILFALYILPALFALFM